jgi:hypothetical protein
MTDEELRKLDMAFAEKVLGYVWMRYAGRPEECGDGVIEAELCSPKDWETYDKGKDGQMGRYMLDDGKYPREEWPSSGRVPRFTKNLEAAFQAVEKLGPGFALNFTREREGKSLWLAWFRVGDVRRAETAPLAICLAALKHVERVKEKV